MILVFSSSQAAYVQFTGFSLPRVFMRRGGSAWMERGALIAILFAGTPVVHGQAAPTAYRNVRPSAFALLGGTYTGLGGATNGLGGRNFSLTAGVNVDVFRVDRFRLAVEARGTYPLSNGHVDGHRSALAGLRLSRTIADASRNSLTPYIDFLAGRGSIHYIEGGYPVPPLLYTYSAGSVYSAGGGLDIRITPALSFIAEAQFQRWATPVVPSGSIISKQASGGFAYRFGTGSRAR